VLVLSISEAIMSGECIDFRRKGRRRAVVLSLSLQAALVAGSMVLNFIEQVRDAVDRTQ
jgi:hypothetical protein